MGWVFLYLYVIGAINDMMFAVNAEADLKDWRTHVGIALWPITVPAAIIVGIYEARKDPD